MDGERPGSRTPNTRIKSPSRVALAARFAIGRCARPARSSRPEATSGHSIRGPPVRRCSPCPQSPWALPSRLPSVGPLLLPSAIPGFAGLNSIAGADRNGGRRCRTRHGPRPDRAWVKYLHLRTELSDGSLCAGSRYGWSVRPFIPPPRRQPVPSVSGATVGCATVSIRTESIRAALRMGR